jgi:hypothetical protein
VPDLLTSPFPIHVFSLKDFGLVADRFDTAGDMITFLETRTDVSRLEELLVQDEAQNMLLIILHSRAVLAPHFVNNPPELIERSLLMFEQKASGKLQLDKDWKYGLLIDDLIAHAHDFDPNLSWNENTTHEAGLRVATFLGWLTRDRRIKLGSWLITTPIWLVMGIPMSSTTYIRAEAHVSFSVRRRRVELIG